MPYKKLKINKKQKNIHFGIKPIFVEFKRPFKIDKKE